MDTSFALALSTLALLATLVLLVLGKRLMRARAERRSERRRVRWVTAVGTGPVPDMRTGELHALARGASHRAASQQDLLALIAGGQLPPRDDRREPFEQALRRGGLQRALQSACESRRPVARGRAALLWADLGLPGAEERIAPMMDDPDPDVRAAATQALASCASTEAAWVLLRALRDGYVEPERVIERLTGAWAVEPLLGALSQPDFAETRPWLAEGLGLTRDPRAELPLVTLLANGEEEQRIRVCRALGRLGLQTSSAALIGALSDESSAVRGQAARALAEVRDKRSVYALANLMGDGDWWVRARAAEALRLLGDPGLTALRWCADSHQDPFARERAAEALALEPLPAEMAAVA